MNENIEYVYMGKLERKAEKDVVSVIGNNIFSFVFKVLYMDRPKALRSYLLTSRFTIFRSLTFYCSLFLLDMSIHIIYLTEVFD